jgi:hypothetical protein
VGQLHLRIFINSILVWAFISMAFSGVVVRTSASTSSPGHFAFTAEGQRNRFADHQPWRQNALGTRSQAPFTSEFVGSILATDSCEKSQPALCRTLLGRYLQLAQTSEKVAFTSKIVCSILAVDLWHLCEKSQSTLCRKLLGFLWVLQFPPTGKVDRVGWDEHS